MRLIDADELKKAFYNQECWSIVIEHIIDNAPTVPIQGQKLGCEICVNRNIKSKEACTSLFGECEFFKEAHNDN